MPTTSDLAAEYRFIFDVILISLLFVLLLLTLGLIFFKQKNVPVSQCIEVDPREPHSITITFVPANVSGNISTDVIVGNNNNNTNNNAAAAGNNNNNTLLDDNQTAPIA